MANINLTEIHDLLIQIAHEAGRMILTATPNTVGSGTKKNSADLVTETDQAVEKMVSATLQAKYPDFSFMGEETYKPGMKLGTEPTFVVDPIDGTTNFVHGFPFVAISLGFVVDRVPTVGVIYNPFLDELWTGVKGEGAFLTKGSKTGDPKNIMKWSLPIRDPEPLTDLSKALIACEWGSDRSGNNYAVKTKVFEKLAGSPEQGGSMVHSIRSMGSAALNLAAVAAGSLDLYWEGGCWAWDVAAGWCILNEAGGLMVSGNPGGEDVQIDSRKYLAVRGAPSGQKEIVEELYKVIGDGRMEYSS